MKIIVIGASVTIGKAVVAVLEQNHEVVRASRNGDVRPHRVHLLTTVVSNSRKS